MSTREVVGSGEGGVSRVDLKLEVVVIPVSDVDRAKAFYRGLGWRSEEHTSELSHLARSRMPSSA